MLIGYARVSTHLQDNATQVDALKKSGCETIFEEKISGGRWERPKLQELLTYPLRLHHYCLEIRPTFQIVERFAFHYGTN